MTKKECLIHVDMDDLWVLRQMYGERNPDYCEGEACYRVGTEQIITLFDEFAVKATFFVSTIDLESEDKRAVVRSIHERGHEIANHGYRHYYLTGLTSEQKAREIDTSHRMVEQCIGQRPHGFRAAGYSIDAEVIGHLRRHGYTYDSSVFPSIVVPLLSLFHGRLSFHHFKHAASRSGPYRVDRDPFRKTNGASGMIELPISTAPFFRMPLTFSYLLLYKKQGLALLEAAMKRHAPLVYLFHLNDFVAYDYGKLRFATFKIPLAERIATARQVLEKIRRHYTFKTSYAWCENYGTDAVTKT